MRAAAPDGKTGQPPVEDNPPVHPNPSFRSTPDPRSLAFARDRMFGTLAVNADPAPLLSHVPFLLAEGGGAADLHLVRSNPIARRPDGPAVLSVSGPDGYVSPDWYRVPDQVPTWNYVAVHLRGRLERLPDAEMRDLLDRQAEEAERRLLPKPPWRADKMTPDILERMIRQIVPFRLHVEGLEATWKLSQNKTRAVRMAAADGLTRAGLRDDADRLAGMMREAITEP